jgi:hypothetical protein
MRVGKRLFPYPVLNNQKNLSGFKNSYFGFDYDLEKKDNNIILKNICYETNNENLEVLIEEGKVCVTCIIECSETLFRNSYMISQTFRDIVIPIYSLKGKVVISAYAYALVDIPEYYDIDFLEEYDGFSFDIEKYDILACDDGYTTKIKYDEQEDNKVASIFLVLKKFGDTSERITVRENDERIIIDVPEKQFDIYDKMKLNPYLRNIFFSILIIPALSYIVEKHKDRDIEDLRLDYNWFVSIENKYEELYNKKLTNDSLKNLAGIEIAQLLMNYPITKGIDELFSLSMNSQQEDEDYE